MATDAPSETSVALNLRKFPAVSRERARQYANARGLTMPEYFERLIALHDSLIERAEAGNRDALSRLRGAGLEPVTR